MAKLSDEQLVKLVPSKNEFMSRHARQILQERAAGKPAVKDALLAMLKAGADTAAAREPGKRACGFYVLATQMLPPVGLIIPYYLALQKLGGLDTYAGLILIHAAIELPFLIWLMWAQ